MWHLGYNDWVKYGWTNEYNTSYQIGDNLYIDLSCPNSTAEQSTPIDCAVDTVKKIINTYPPPYNLMCSGGVDSQAMIYAWIKSQVPFNVFSVKYVSDGINFNDFDLVNLSTFSNLHNFNVTYLELDIINFLENDLTSISQKYDCGSPQICTHIRFADFIKTGTIIYSGNWIKQRTMIPFDYSILGLHRYALSLNSDPDKKVVPFFFCHTADLAYSFTNYTPGQDKKFYKDNTYINAGFPIIPVEKQYNGFEKVKSYYSQFEHRVTRKMRFHTGNFPSKQVFDFLFRFPLDSVKIKARTFYKYRE